MQDAASVLKFKPPMFISARYAGLIPTADILDPYSAELPSRIHDCVIAAFDRILRGLDHDDDPAIDLISRRLIEARDSMAPTAWQRIVQRFEDECYV